MKLFEKINTAYNTIFTPNKLTIGVGIPIENNQMNPIATMNDHIKRAKLVEQLGFKALWVRDIPFFVPSFGDAGQVYEPFTYLGYLAAHTESIALGTASIALPLHHPAHIAKAAASLDQLSGGRFLMGVASGDRPTEYPAMNIDYQKRSQLFREAFEYIRKSAEPYPKFYSENYGQLDGSLDIIPKPTASKIPMLVTAHSQQSIAWNAEFSDGWMNYPMGQTQLETTIKEWRGIIAQKYDYDKPYMQSLFIDLHPDDNFKPVPLHLGFRAGANYLIAYFNLMRDIGVNHIGVVLRFNSNHVEDTLQQISNKILPHFH
ncbi:LLM class oxidoreductase [Tenacibaculum sp. UWU-22]|uniref:LLM class oxidoreductase n=1 Tax=Tenacibaculum sp. UWU-22 TaxID=3234187 RepID=UPI0034DB5D43